MKQKIYSTMSSFFSLLALGFALFFVLSLHGTITGQAVFVLDDDVTADQIATIAALAGPGDETKMLSEVDLSAGSGYIIFSALDDGESATIKERDGNIYVAGNVEDAVEVLADTDYPQLLEDNQGVIEIVNGEIVEDEEQEEGEEIEEAEEETTQEETRQEETDELTSTCTDESGTVAVTYSDGTMETGYDYCSGMEFVDVSCSSKDKLRKVQYSCTYSCSQSYGCGYETFSAINVLDAGGDEETAIATTCQDSDGGVNKEKAGTATYGYTTYTDTCSSEKVKRGYYSSSTVEKWYVAEAYCINNGKGIAQEKMECGSEYTCSDGACVPKKASAANVQIFSSTEEQGISAYPSCKTTDTGIQFSTSSTGKSPYTNFCHGSSEFRYVCLADNEYALIEQSCTDGCTYGKGCNEGYVAKSDAVMTKTTFMKAGQYCKEDQDKNFWGVDSSGKSFSVQQYCMNDIYLKEYLCDADYDYSTNIATIRFGEGNTVCENGCDSEKGECRTERVDFGKASCTETATGVTGTDYVGRSYTYETKCDDYYLYDTSGKMYIMASQTSAYCDETTKEPKVKSVYCGDDQENMGIGYACGVAGSCVLAEERPKVSNCFDTDDLNKNVFGTLALYDANGAMTTFSDSCTTKNGKEYVVEQFCNSDGSAAAEEMLCDSFCFNGVCDKMGDYCEDSDGGIDSSTSGAVQYFKESGDGGMGYDECTGDKTLKEWYCDGDKVQSKTIQCKEYCYGTVCDTMSLECSDSETGADPAVAGYLSYYSLDGTTTSYEDTCTADAKAVTDWYCDGKDVKSKEFICDGYCSYGSCTAIETPFFSEIMTVDAFLASTQDWYYDMKIVIPSKGSTSDYLAALALVGKYAYPLVKDTEVSDYRTIHAIVVGSPSVNTVSKAVIDAGATKEGAYYVYQDPTYYGTILVVGSDDPKETRKAVKELVRR